MEGERSFGIQQISYILINQGPLFLDISLEASVRAEVQF